MQTQTICWVVWSLSFFLRGTRYEVVCQTNWTWIHLMFFLEHVFLTIVCTALASNREGGVGFDLHFWSVRCSTGVVVCLPWIYLTLLVRTMVLGHMLVTLVYKMQTQNMNLQLELTFQVCCRLQQVWKSRQFQKNMTQMWSCSLRGSHCLVVNWRCHGRADFGTNFWTRTFQLWKWWHVVSKGQLLSMLNQWLMTCMMIQ